MKLFEKHSPRCEDRGEVWELVLNLLAQIQLIERRLVSRSRGALEIIKQPATACDHLEQAAPGGVILEVRLEMLGEVIDAFGQNGDLHVRAAGIFLVQPEGGDGFGRGHDVLKCFGFCSLG